MLCKQAVGILDYLRAGLGALLSESGWCAVRQMSIPGPALAEFRHKAMVIGQVIGGDKLELDLAAQVDTRLLIQKNSGFQTGFGPLMSGALPCNPHAHGDSYHVL